MRPHARRRTDTGAAAVELALVLPVLFLVVAGIVDLGRVMYTQVMLTNAAREGARVAITSAPAGDIATRARAAAPALPAMTVASTTCSTPGTSAVVTTRTPFEWILLGPAMAVVGGGGALPAGLSSRAEMRCY